MPRAKKTNTKSKPRKNTPKKTVTKKRATVKNSNSRKKTAVPKKIKKVTRKKTTAPKKIKKTFTKSKPRKYTKKKVVKKTVKKVKKPTQRVKKKVAKKTARKTTARKIIKKTAPKAEIKPIETINQVQTAKPSQPRIKTLSEQHGLPPSNFLVVKQIKTSPHLINLKEIQEQKNLELNKEVSTTEKIAQELFGNVNKNPYLSKFLNTQNNLKNKFKKIKSKSRQINNPLKQIQPIEINFPKIKAPQFNLPKIQLPKIKLPHFKLPAIKISKLNLPAIKIKIPKLPKLRDIQIGRLKIPATWPKTILSFAVFALLFTLPFTGYNYYQDLKAKKASILDYAGQALMHLTLSKQALSAQDFYYTQYELNQAASKFSLAQNELNDLNLITKSLIKIVPQTKQQYQTANNLISAGKNLSQSAAIISQNLEELNFETSLESLYLTDKLSQLKQGLLEIQPLIKQANQDLQNIYLNEVPAEYQGKIKDLQLTLPLIEANLQSFIEYSDLMTQLLGHQEKKSYLLLFQNNNEIRPTGGFIGSMALMDIDRGNLERFKIPGGGPYDLRSGLKVNLLSPKPLHLINPRWEFQDANWFADLPTSAEKLAWFYEKSGGPTVDGIIFINASFFEEILKVIGPIELQDYNNTITADNFYQEIQHNVELNYNKLENKPKQIIADLAPIVIDRLLNADPQKLGEIMASLLTALNQKEIQLYFTDYNIQKIVLNNNWGGQLHQTLGDYLNIVSTNIAGEKTDAKIIQEADLDVEIQADGSVINTLKITKKHLGKDGEIFYGVPNLDYLRIYVPLNSELIEANGFTTLPKELFTVLDHELYDIDPELNLSERTKRIEQNSQTEIFAENGKTVFANWLKVNPGETKTVSISYRLPFKINLDSTKENLQDDGILDKIKKEIDFKNIKSIGKYTLIWQKQSGKRNFEINLNINFPEILDYQLIHPQTMENHNNIFNYSSPLDKDKIFAITF